MFTWDFNMGNLIALVAQVAVVIGFVVNTRQAARDAAKAAIDADKSATAAHVRANEAHVVAVEALARIATFREEAARRFVTDEMLQAVENRVIDAIHRLGDRFDRVIEMRSRPPEPAAGPRRPASG
jgi:hypothetical protein